MQTIANQKKIIRAKLLEKRKAIGKTACLSKSQAITKRLLALPEFIAAKTIHFYLSDDTEVQTDGLIEESLRLGKQVVVPLLDEMALSQIDDLHPDHFEMHPFGIRSLKEPFCKVVSSACVDLWILPGVGYDRMGHRLGRGAGYYDRLLSGISAKITGLAFECQIVEMIPILEHDKQIDQIITEERTIICRRER
ncbi:MAG: 5-formyltetrahydrofolate cyclo-ligase [Nitrospirota bacterium]